MARGGGKKNTTNSVIPQANDVLLGRGCQATQHHGNVVFRFLVYLARPVYSSLGTRGMKSEIAKLVIKQVEALDPPGRFVEYRNGEFFLAPPHKVHDKTTMALREKKNGCPTEYRELFETQELNARTLARAIGMRLEHLQRLEDEMTAIIERENLELVYIGRGSTNSWSTDRSSQSSRRPRKFKSRGLAAKSLLHAPRMQLVEPSPSVSVTSRRQLQKRTPRRRILDCTQAQDSMNADGSKGYKGESVEHPVPEEAKTLHSSNRPEPQERYCQIYITDNLASGGTCVGFVELPSLYCPVSIRMEANQGPMIRYFQRGGRCDMGNGSMENPFKVWIMQDPLSATAPRRPLAVSPGVVSSSPP